MRLSFLLRLTLPLLIFFGSRVILNRATDRNTISPQSANPVITAEAPQAQIPAQPAQTIQNLPTDQIEALIHEKINLYRQSQGLKPLTVDYRITEESRKYSAKMASGAAEFSHDGFDQRAENLEKRALKYQSVAENLALLQGYDDLATVAVEGWIDSPGHHKNIIGDFDLTGIGVVKNEEGVYYFTQLFLKRQ